MNKQPRSRATNYIGLAENIVDSYPVDLYHGLQKDAIQNGWDAIPRQVKLTKYVRDNWRFCFELKKDVNNQTILTMTDSGTVGMTGNLISDDIDDNLVLDENERWARWESLAFRKTSNDDTLGARGQGKMIFMWASTDKRISYDSFRQDGTYKMGETKLTTKDSPVDDWSEDEARQRIKDKVGLSPLDIFGSRIIIHQPLPEIIKAIDDGSFLKAIEETWWPNILKYGAKISVTDSFGDTKLAQTPAIYKELFEKPPDSHLNKYWYKQNLKLEFKGQTWKIKKIFLGHNKEFKLPDHHRGVAYFRGGMKINRINFSPQEIEANSYGFIEFDKNLDKLLRTVEDPTHYKFKKSGENASLWGKIEQLIKIEIQIFAGEKLGFGIKNIQHEKAKKNQRIDQIALTKIKKITKTWNLKIRGKRSSTGFSNAVTDKIISNRTFKSVGIKMHGFKLPNKDSQRINYGQSIRYFVVEIFNNSQINYRQVGLKVRILRQSSQLEVLLEEQFSLQANTNRSFRPLNLHISPATFSSFGEYRLKIDLLDYSSDLRPTIDALTRRFWVESDPPIKDNMPFEIKYSSFNTKPELVDREWALESKGSDYYILYINTDHPSYKEVEQLPESPHSEDRHLFHKTEIMSMALVQIVCRRLDEGFEDVDNVAPFLKERLEPYDNMGEFESRYHEITRLISKIRKDLLLG